MIPNEDYDPRIHGVPDPNGPAYWTMLVIGIVIAVMVVYR